MSIKKTLAYPSLIYFSNRQMDAYYKQVPHVAQCLHIDMCFCAQLDVRESDGITKLVMAKARFQHSEERKRITENYVNIM